MKAMILAAGRGLRLRPLTDSTPKPLISIANKPLILHQVLKLAKIGIKEIIINVSYQAKQIIETLGDGHAYGVKIDYSFEPTALETGGGICQALSILGSNSFIVLSADIWTDFPFASLGVYHPDLFSNKSGTFPLSSLLYKYIAEKKITGECYQGLWFNIGTPTELERLNAYLEQKK